MVPIDLRQLRATCSRHKGNNFRAAAMVEMSYRFHPKLDALLTSGEAVRQVKDQVADEEFVRAAQTAMASPDFASRVDRIEDILLRAGAKKVDRGALKSLMVMAALLYGGMASVAERDTEIMREMSKLAGPLASVLEGFKLNKAAILGRLGAPLYVPARGTEAAYDAVRKAVETRFDNMYAALEEIGRGLSDPPPKKDTKKRDLDALFDLLAHEFEKITGNAFTQDWHTNDQGQREAAAPGAQFAHEIVGFIDPERLPDVPGAMRRVVTARRNSTFQK
jgi:hypothetical protein